MALTSVNGGLAGARTPQPLIKQATGTLVAGRPHSLFYTAGAPSPGVAPSSGVSGSVHTGALAGCLSFFNDAVLQKYLMRLQAQSSAQSGTLMLCDRIWSNSGLNVTLTTSQTVNSVAFARDDNNAINGVGIMVGMEVSTALGAGTPTLTLGYTNEANTAGRSGSNIQSVVASSIAGTFHPFGLQSGDRGVRSIQSFTSSATMTSGAIHLVAYRVLAMLELGSAGFPAAIDMITGGRPELFNDTCLWPVFIPGTTSTTQITGHFIQTNA